MFSEFVTKIAEKLSNINLPVLGLLLATALGSALIVYWRTVEHKSFRDFFDFAFPAEVILHPSARADFLFWITKKLMMPVLLIPAGVVLVASVGYATKESLRWLFGI